MWVLLVLSLAAMSVLTIIQTPKEWLKKPVPRILILIYYAVGITSTFMLLFVVYRMKDGFFREAVIWTETLYFTLTLFGLILSVVRYFAFETARHFNHRKILHLLNSNCAFYLAVLLLSTAYMIPSVYNATNLKTTSYEVQVNKTCSEDTLTVAVISDFHVGGGARHKELDQMAELTRQANPDLILIAGDVCDSSSSVSDLEYMEKTLATLHCRYGVFYAEGNHERECRIDPSPYLLRAGVTILADEGLILENGVNLVGRKNELAVDVPQILAESGLDDWNPTIVIQHRTNGLPDTEGNADLVVCGHTHGYQFPFCGVFMPYTQKIAYGYRQYGDLNAVVTSGVAEWGYRTKWPSQSEIAVIHVTFGEGTK